MVRVELDFTKKKVVIIDDAECTPGDSRQYTRFREHCVPVLEKSIKNLSTPLSKEAADTFANVIKETCVAHMFAYKTGEIENNKLMLYAETTD